VTTYETNQQERTRTPFTHRHVTAIPYHRDGGFYNDKAHIRWTTSNFLHSGSWESHRGRIWFDNIDLLIFFIITLY
jgi:hypothetical protein